MEKTKLSESLNSDFVLLKERKHQQFISWNNGKYKFPIGPLKYIPKSGLLFYDIITSKSKDKKILDLGCGEMGIISLFAIEGNAKSVIAVDIDEQCISWLTHIKKTYSLNSLQVIKSNMFQNIKGKFDIIVSNPPIMPMQKMNIKTIHDAGGIDGRLYLINIIKNALSYLENDGCLYLSAFSFLGTDTKTNEDKSLKEYALILGYSSFEIIKRIIKPLSSNSLTYKQLPYIKTIYPKMSTLEYNEKPAVEFQILCIRK